MTPARDPKQIFLSGVGEERRGQGRGGERRRSLGALGGTWGGILGYLGRHLGVLGEASGRHLGGWGGHGGSGSSWRKNVPKHVCFISKSVATNHLACTRRGQVSPSTVIYNNLARPRTADQPAAFFHSPLNCRQEPFSVNTVWVINSYPLY